MKKYLWPLLLLSLAAQGAVIFPPGGGSSGGNATNAIGKTNGLGYGTTTIEKLIATNITANNGNIVIPNAGQFIGNGTGITNISSDFYSNTFLSMETKNRTLNDYEGQPALNYGNPQAVFTYGTFEVSGDLNNSGFTHLGDAVNQHTFVTGRFFRQTNTFGGVGDPNRSYTLIDTNGNLFTTNAGIANSWLGFTNGVLSVGESAGNGTIQAPYFTLGTVIFLAETSPGNMEIVTTTCQADGAWNFPDGVSGDGSGLSSLGADRISSANMFSARLGTNSGSDGQVLSITGNKTKWVDQTGGSGSGTFNAAALTNWPNTTLTNANQRFTASRTNFLDTGTLTWVYSGGVPLWSMSSAGLFVFYNGITGDGSGLTNLNASTVFGSGVIPAAQAGELSNHLHMAGTPLTAGDIYGWDGSKFTNGPQAGGVGGAQTPWASDINGAGKSLTNANSLTVTQNVNIIGQTSLKGIISGSTAGPGIKIQGTNGSGVVQPIFDIFWKDSTSETDIYFTNNPIMYVFGDTGFEASHKITIGSGQITAPVSFIGGTFIGGGASLTNEPRMFGTTLDGAGSVLSTGQCGYWVAPSNGCIKAWSIVAAGTSPTCTFDIWKVAAGTALPTVANTIMGTKPALATGNVLRSVTLTSWTTNYTAGDIFGFNLDAVANATWVKLQIESVNQ